MINNGGQKPRVAIEDNSKELIIIENDEEDYNSNEKTTWNITSVITDTEENADEQDQQWNTLLEKEMKKIKDNEANKVEADTSKEKDFYLNE